MFLEEDVECCLNENIIQLNEKFPERVDECDEQSLKGLGRVAEIWILHSAPRFLVNLA